MSRRSQDIPIRPRYGYADEAGGEDAASSSHKLQQRNNACGTPASYSEIPFLAQYAGPVPEHVLQDITPTAGKVPPPGSESYMNLDSGEDDDHDDDDGEEEDEEEPSNSNSKDSSNEPSKPSTNRPKSLQSSEYILPYFTPVSTSDQLRSISLRAGGRRRHEQHRRDASFRGPQSGVEAARRHGPQQLRADNALRADFTFPAITQRARGGRQCAERH